MSVEPAEIEELRGRVRGIIGAYGMGDSVDPRKLYLKNAPATPPPPVPVPVGGNISDGVIPNNALGYGASTVNRAPSRGEATRLMVDALNATHPPRSNPTPTRPHSDEGG